MGNKALNVWYKDGLPFKCTGCGKCCTGAPGYVWLTEKDIKRFAEYFEITREEFLKEYCRFVQNKYSLRESPENFDCVFFKNKQCTVYKARPKQCRTFPFWKENLKDEVSWCSTAVHCEGIGHEDAENVSYEEIEKIRNQ